MTMLCENEKYAISSRHQMKNYTKQAELHKLELLEKWDDLISLVCLRMSTIQHCNSDVSNVT